ncbi:MAG: asparagine synthase (glutamine-hydrolyzing) [Cyanobacteriota bacterium]
MCGICGIFEYGTGQPVAPAQLQRMNDTLMHRGPDEEGCLIQPGIGMAMRRLKIIDLAGGHQPIPNEDETVWIVFNGEIYNYQSLRNELINKGHRFRTRSDTEVILHLYEEYGRDCVHHLDGMFAFAIYDRRPPQVGTVGRLLIARDRLGKKPLYYTDTGKTLVFGSEIKPILQDPRISKDLDLEAVHHYLSLLVVPAPHSIFKQIRKLPAGCLLECDADGIRISQYWNYQSFISDRKFPEREAISEIRQLLFAAVEKRLIAEVPLGAFLSGGLDSSAVVAIMSQLKNEPVKTFSIGFEGSQTHNELPYARILAEHCKTDHHEILVKPDIVETVQELVHYTDEPFAISSAVPTFLMSKAARQQVTVVLTGDGGDEMFGGYPHYLYERWATAYRYLPSAFDPLLLGSTRLLQGRIDQSSGRLRSQISRFVDTARRSPGQRRMGWFSGFSEIEKRQLYTATLRHSADSHSTANFLEEQAQDNKTLHPAVQQNTMDILVSLPDEMLAKVDRTTMAASIEARSPLLDWQLVEYLAGLSFEQKFPGWRMAGAKHLLRQAIADLLPPDLLGRRKQGFNVPLDNWFRTGAKDYLESVLSPERIKRRGLFDPIEVESLLSRHQAGIINANNRLYALMVFEVWAEEFL